MHSRLVTLAATLATALSARADAAPTAAPVDFTRDVRPILSAHCFACHGPDHESRKARLSLVTFEEATANRGGAAAVAPGDRDASLLWERVNDVETPMPPASAHKPLTPGQIETLGRWIDEGASYAPHWAYVPPVETPPPPVNNEWWPTGEIDRFVLARLQEEDLAPAPDADPLTLLRRLTFDIIGLPPTTAAIDAFLAQPDPDHALAGAVERLLASPHYGERMAMYWLDLVRYADTVGYHGDQEHRAWPYRDYVIEAFNENLPFDRFTIEQLAGDLLPEPTQDQLVATAYNRLLQTTHEGGLQLGEYRAIYLADRVRNASAVWMGATLGCAQCHDHKYDPYTARDFYAFGAFFADIDDEEHLRKPYDGLNSTPTLRTPEMRLETEASTAARRQVDASLARARIARDAAIAALPAQQAAWEADLLRLVASGETREQPWVDDALTTGGRVSGDWTFIDDAPFAPHSGSLCRVQSAPGLVQHYTVDTTETTITLAEGDVLFAWVRLPAESRPTALMLQFNVKGDWEHRAVWGNDDITYGRRAENWPGYSRRGPLPASGAWSRLEVAAADVGLQPGDVITGMAFTQFGGTVYWDDAGVSTGQIAPESVVAALRTAPGERSDDQQAAIARHHAETSEDVRLARAAVSAIERERRTLEASLPLSLYTRPLETPRTVRVLPRGNWLDDSGDVVDAAIPAFMGELDTVGRATRLDLARWLTTPEAEGGAGGLTARVFVNRVWTLFFGTGLCPSPEDFGGQGTPPNHPELLDHLALAFIASGWDVKALVRSIVTSRAYRQSSIPASGVAERDPLNHLYARQSRFRLAAEMIRDTALAVSGLLVDDLGGPSVKPPQPSGYYRHLNFPPRTYEPDMGDAQWRRGVYVHWQRQFLHPMLGAFDAPTREECTAQRPVSNTPTAALTLLNDPTFVEAARAFAERILRQPAASDADRITWAMREATARRPSPAEVTILTALLNENRRQYAGDGGAAAALLGIGQAPRDTTLEVAEHAAWTQVARALLNLHETITRD